MYKVLLAVLFLCVSAFGQQSVKPTNGLGKELILGAAGKVYNSGLVAVTTTLTAFTSTTTKVQLIHCSNISGSDATITITDGADTEYFTTVTVAANSVMVVHYGTVGLTYTSGIKFDASANSALKCQVEGVQ